MKYIFSILFLLVGINLSAQSKIQYAPNRTKGDVIVTDVAWRAGEFLQVPTTTLQNPSIGSYVDSTGRIFYTRFDSTLLVRNNGTWFRFFNSNKINAMDALVVHLAGTETITGAKTFNGNIVSAGTTTVGNDIIWNNNTGFGLKGQDNVRFLSYTTALGASMPTLRIGGGSLIQPGAPIFTLVGKAWITDTLNAAGLIRPANDIIWANNSGFGLRGSDGVRFLNYTTAGGTVVGTTATTVSVANLTTAGVVTNTSAGLLGTVTRLTTANIDTGRAAGKVATAESLNKVKDSITTAIATSVSTRKLIGGSSSPSVSLGANITGSVAVTGTDLAGTVTVTVTGASGLATLNELFTLTYNSAYSSTPHVVWSAASVNAAQLLQAAGGLYLKNSGTPSFQIATVNSYTTPASATYSFTYHVIQ